MLFYHWNELKDKVSHFEHLYKIYKYIEQVRSGQQRNTKIKNSTQILCYLDRHISVLKCRDVISVEKNINDLQGFDVAKYCHNYYLLYISVIYQNNKLVFFRNSELLLFFYESTIEYPLPIVTSWNLIALSPLSLYFSVRLLIFLNITSSSLF